MLLVCVERALLDVFVRVLTFQCPTSLGRYQLFSVASSSVCRITNRGVQHLAERGVVSQVRLYLWNCST